MQQTLLELGSGSINRLLFITPRGDSMSDFWNDTLRESGFRVSYASFEDWESAILDESPQIILLNASEDIKVAFRLCRKMVTDHCDIPLVSIIMRSDLSTQGTTWHAGGAKNFLRLNATRAEIITTLQCALHAAEQERTIADLKEQLLNARQFDGATQLLTRRHFFHDAHRECERARRYGRPLSCIMININYYDDYRKMFDDACTNYLLRQISLILRNWTRESDVVARFAPQKIVALLPETDIHGATTVRERLLEAIDGYEFEWAGKKLPVSVSVGEAERTRLYDAPLPDAEVDTLISIREEIAQLLEDADTALAVAQRSAHRPAIFITYDEIPPTR